MTKTKTYTVTRWCCLSGLCIDCHSRGNHGNKDHRARIVHADNLTEKLARRMVEGWRAYDAKMEPREAKP